MFAATHVNDRSAANRRQPDSAHQPDGALESDSALQLNSARAAAVLFADWTDEQPARELMARIGGVQPYTPGEFSRRQRPCLLAVLKQAVQPTGPLSAVIVDGYVMLNAAGHAGLGLHLYEALRRTVPVIGVAKTACRGPGHAVSLLRGSATRPLYIGAAGLEAHEAARPIRTVAGSHPIRC